jgi:phytoene synthase
MTGPSDYCEDLVRDRDKDRFLATLFAPATRRSDLFALYAFDLETAAVATRVRDPVAGEIRLQWWHDALTDDQAASGHPVADALKEMLPRHGLNRTDALDVIDARRRALYPDSEVSEAAFELAASEAEGAIFRMAAQVLDREIGEPARLAAHHAGVITALSHLKSGAVSFDVRNTTRRHRSALRDLILHVPEPVLPAFLPVALAVEERASLPQWRKQWILWRASRNLARWI